MVFKIACGKLLIELGKKQNKILDIVKLKFLKRSHRPNNFFRRLFIDTKAEQMSTVILFFHTSKNDEICRRKLRFFRHVFARYQTTKLAKIKTSINYSEIND